MNWAQLIGIIAPSVVDVIKWLLHQKGIPINEQALAARVPTTAVTPSSLWAGFRAILMYADQIISDPTKIEQAIAYIRVLEILLGMQPPPALAHEVAALAPTQL
jgi:hypothetical protein